MAAFPHVVTDPTVDSDGALARLLRELDFAAPYVKKQRCQRHTFHLLLKVSGPAGDHRVFVKVYRRPPIRNALTLFLPSRAAREWRNSRAAAARGVMVPAAIAYGERRVGGIVVDQFVAFRHIPRTRTVTLILRRAIKRKVVVARRHWIERFAGALSAMHCLGYRHGACSPRNTLVKRHDPTKTLWWIDHPRGRLFPRSIHRTRAALPDLLQTLASPLLIPDEASAAYFLECYAPGAIDYHRDVLARRRPVTA